MNLQATMHTLGQQARSAARILATVPRETKDRALQAAARMLIADSATILAENAKEYRVYKGERAGVSFRAIKFGRIMDQDE